MEENKEIIQVVDKQDHVIGQDTLHNVHMKGLRHREAWTHLISGGRVLLQKRTDNGLWDHASAGHFGPDESYLEGARREFKEELGIDIPKSAFTPILKREFVLDITIKLDGNSVTFRNDAFAQVYLIQKSIPIKKFKIDPVELAEIRYFSPKQTRKIIAEGKVVRNTEIVLEEIILPILEKNIYTTT